LIHVSPAPEPGDFDAKVRQPGLLAMAEMTGRPPSRPRTSGKPFRQRKLEVEQANGAKVKIAITDPAELPGSEFPPYWTKALDDLREAYNEICAYCCFRIHPATGAASVDHMAPKSRFWDRVYEWDNYRLCSSLLNARKKDFGDVLDPFLVKDEWFEIELVGFQVRPRTGMTDGALRTQVEQTARRLGLNDLKFRKEREKRALDYWERGLPIEILEEEAPFLAREIRRQNQLRSGDS